MTGNKSSSNSNNNNHERRGDTTDLIQITLLKVNYGKVKLPRFKTAYNQNSHHNSGGNHNHINNNYHNRCYGSSQHGHGFVCASSYTSQRNNNNNNNDYNNSHSHHYSRDRHLFFNKNKSNNNNYYYNKNRSKSANYCDFERYNSQGNKHSGVYNNNNNIEDNNNNNINNNRRDFGYKDCKHCGSDLHFTRKCPIRGNNVFIDNNGNLIQGFNVYSDDNNITNTIQGNNGNIYINNNTEDNGEVYNTKFRNPFRYMSVVTF